jgi:2-dehydro-3-deoxyphosphogluconate aldolase/(4S)-4-hydroxy-2-oxoglutarate aldolase
MTAFSAQQFEKLPLIGILRGFSSEKLEFIVDACIRGGLTNLEITMNTPDALAQIRTAVRLSQGNLNVGAGTVLIADQLKAALQAGASFIVTPTLQREIIRSCVGENIPVFPGAFSPTEIAEAWHLGATMVKIFPAESLGPAYIKSIKAPFPQIKLLPTGGVDLSTIESYIKAGADGFGIGSPLFNRDRIEAGDWAWMRNQCAAFVEAYRRFRCINSD